MTLTAQSTQTQVNGHESAPKPWQSWGLTIRYLVVRLAQATPNAMLVWLAYVRH